MTPRPSPTQGLLRIHLLAGQNLVPKDNLMGGLVKGKSDPYVKINIGGETFTSEVIKTNLNPTWNEMYEVNNSCKHTVGLVLWCRVTGSTQTCLQLICNHHQVILTELPGQELHVEVLDKDMDMKDDFMGRYSHNRNSKMIHFMSVNSLLMLSNLTITSKMCRLKVNLKDIVDSQYTDQVGIPLLKATSACPPTCCVCAYLHSSAGDRGGGGTQRRLTLANVPNTLKLNSELLLGRVAQFAFPRFSHVIVNREHEFVVCVCVRVFNFSP